MKIKNKIQIILVLMLLFIMSFSISSFAVEIETGEYSQKYEEWLNLDEEERKNTIPPLPVNIRNTSNSISKYNVLKQSSTIPEKYDLRDEVQVKVKNQMNTGSCWTFSANTLVETYLLKNNKSYDFSERHMEYNTANSVINGSNPDSLNRNIGSGGNSTTAFTYYSRGSGPVLEQDMPFQNNENPVNSVDLPTNITMQKVDDMVYFPNIYKRIENGNVICEDASGYRYTTAEVAQIRNQVKEHIMNYGAVSIAINADGYNLNTETWADNLNISGILPNHAVTIIGWDDNYSRDNFLSRCKPTTDGAYIVLNSWGSDWGENGVYYISYEDLLVEAQMTGVAKVSDIEYKNLYQHDTCEMYGWLNAPYAANTFTSKENERLTEIMIGTWAEQTCNIYVNPIGSGFNLNYLKKIASNVKIKPGYNTIKVNENIEITKGNSFTIVVEILGNYVGIGVESGKLSASDVNSKPGESYVSFDSSTWYDTYNKDDMMNLCIKAYTQTKEKNIEFGKIKCTVRENVGGTIGIPILTSHQERGSTVQVKILKDGKDVTSSFKIQGNKIKANGAYITLKCPNNIERGHYNIQVKTPNTNLSTKNILLIGEKIDLSKGTISTVSNKIYNGTNITQSITVKYGNKTLVNGKDYIITYQNNKNIGQATIKITGKGNYTGTITKYFNILPQKVNGLKTKSQSADSITISWSKVADTTGYSVYSYNDSKKNWEYKGETKNTNYTIKKLKPGTTYKFRVIAYKNINNNKYWGEYSSNLQTTTTPSKVSGLKAKSQTTNTIKMTWSKASGATGYKLYSYNYSKEKWDYVGKTKNTSYTIKKLKAGNTYKYRVRAYRETNNTQYYGSYTTSVKTATKTKTPKITKITTKSKKATIKWGKIKEASGYEIYMATSKKGKYSKVKTIKKSNTLNYTKSGLKKKKTYYFKIRTYKTVDGKKIYSSYSSVKSIKIK